MIATQNQQHTPREGLGLDLPLDKKLPVTENELVTSKIQCLDLEATTPLVTSKIVTHHPKAGLNPLADTAAYLISVLGKLKYIKSFRLLGKLQKELIQEINFFQETAKKHGYNAEYIVVCRYVLCATFDDVIANTSWGGQGQWEPYQLLSAFQQDPHHHDKFFIVLERALKDPALYIDLLELYYICLSLGYKGRYRSTEHNQYQLEQIVNQLYKHIRAYRGSFSKTLSPSLPKFSKHFLKTKHDNPVSLLTTVFVTACINVIIFISLGYLMDVISNEAYKNVKQVQKSVYQQTTHLA